MQMNRSFGFSGISEGAKWIILVTTGVSLMSFLLANLAGRLALYPYGSPYFFFWQPLTYMFVHGGAFHLLFNMLVVWFFAPQYEAEFGRNQLLKLYFYSGVGTGILYSVFVGNSVLIGASAGVYGLLIAFAYFWPNAQVYLMGIFPIPAKIMILILIGMGFFFTIQPQSGDRIAHIAHIFGAGIAFLYLQWNHGRYRFLRSFFHFIQNSFKTQKQSFNSKPPSKKNPKSSSHRPSKIRKKTLSSSDSAVNKRVDELLEKVHQHGVESLSKEEKEFLDQVSRDYQSDS